jgi:prolyl-tRNA synthetase
MVGGVIMTHGDDDGLRVPPAIAPFQVVILPMLRDSDADAALLDYCDGLRAQLAAGQALGEQVRVLLDKRSGKAAQKRWDWVRKGVPLILEVGPRDAEGGQVSVLRRHRLWREDGKPDFQVMDKAQFAAAAPAELECIQRELYQEARDRRAANMVQLSSFDDLGAFFAEDKRYPGWAEVQWSRPTGAELDQVIARLKALKLTFRNVPLDASPAEGACVFSGVPAVERILVARSY